MNSPKPLRHYVLVDRREVRAGISRMKLAPVTGLLEVAPPARRGGAGDLRRCAKPV